MIYLIVILIVLICPVIYLIRKVDRKLSDQIVARSKEEFEKDHPGYEQETLVEQNIRFINFLRRSGFKGKVYEDSWDSYLVDYYESEINNGGFSQFVYNTRNKNDPFDELKRGLKKINAERHLDYLNQRIEALNNIDSMLLTKFLNGPYFGDETGVISLLDDDKFYELNKTENLSKLNEAFLESHPRLVRMEIKDWWSEAEHIVGHKINPFLSVWKERREG